MDIVLAQSLKLSNEFQIKTMVTIKFVTAIISTSIFYDLVKYLWNDYYVETRIQISISCDIIYQISFTSYDYSVIGI